VIIGYHAHVDLAKAGREVLALIRMSCYGPSCVLRDDKVPTWPEVLEINRVTGDTCCVLKVAASSIETFEAVIDRLGGYGAPSSTMILSTPLTWQAITPIGS
jgi:Lrp/AsnC family leucine-responsive transcriptional regulator